MSEHAEQQTELRADSANNTVTKNRRAGAEAQARPISTLSWSITLFGTAIGAGVLFLPIDSGRFGFWPLLIATILIGPMVFLSHRAVSRLVAASPHRGQDILVVLSKYFGPAGGALIALVYWLCLFPVVLIYGVSITNTVDSFIVNQLNGPSINRALLSLICVGVMTASFAFGQRVMMKVAQFLVYPLIAALAVVAIYLIPQWDLASFMDYEGYQGIGGFLSSFVLILPVLVFSFSFLAALSQFSLDMQRQFGKRSEQKSSQVLLLTTILLVALTMFFVWSCVMALGADGMKQAREDNIPVLSYFANVTGAQFMAYMAPLVSVAAITSSYFGHVLGTTEGTRYLFRLAAPKTAANFSDAAMNRLCLLFIFLATTIVSALNPPVLDLITLVGGPLFGVLLFLLPVYTIHRIDALAKYRPLLSNWFVAVMGILVVAASVWSMFT